MRGSKYQTIDPLILQTLNLNQKRIHHIFDILHGRDSSVHSVKPARTDPQQTKRSRLPNISQHRENDYSPERAPYSVPRPANKQHREHKSIAAVREQHQPRQPTLRARKIPQLQNRKVSTTVKSQARSLHDGIHDQVDLRRPAVTDRQSTLARDYGMSQLKKSKSLEINPKDVYRLEIENIVSRYTEIEGLEEEERQMVRLKKRYQHLYRFDKNYYMALCRNDFSLL